MKFSKGFPWRSALAILALACVGTALAVDPPAAPKLSEKIPAEDLVGAADGYIDDIKKGLATADSYNSKKDNIVRDSNTLIALSLVLAKHDADHAWKGSAANVMKAAQELAGATDYDGAKAALEKVEAAKSASGGDDPEWGKVARMGQLMKQVTFVNNRIRRNARRVERTADELAADAAVLAAIAQVVTYDTHEVKNPDDTGKWYEFCAEMRDAASELNAKARAKDADGVKEAITRVQKNCDACHAVFRPDQL